jgi:flagellar assembly protein FliH
MGIIAKENASSVTPFSFSDSRGEMVEASSWQLSGDENPALPPPEAQEIQADSGLESARTAGAPGDIPQASMPEMPPPVFEVPEHILAGFYDQIVLTGLEDGRNQVLAELNILQERFAAAIEGLGAVSQQLASQNQVQIMTLACQIAGRLVRDEIQLRPEKMVALIEEALGNQDPSESVVIRCGPGDYEYIVSQKPHLEAGVGATFTVRVELDETLEYGDFQIETRKGQIDGRVETRVAEVKAAIQGGGDV